MQESAKLPTFVLEEHHEAFLVWNYAILNGLIPKDGNDLVHFDEHSDMNMPRLNVSLDTLKKNIDEIKYFTYSELNIATFILSAVYQGIFNKVTWVKQSHKHSEQKQTDMFISSCNDLGKKILSGRIDPQITYDQKSIQSFKAYSYIQTHDFQLENATKPFILDIDLDYFSCIQNPYENYEIEIEITEAEFQEFHNNPYHRLRFITSKLDAIEWGGKFYYVINKYNETYESSLKVSDNEIENRINRFFNHLSNQSYKPLMITICRSRFSGFTPEDQWKMIETGILKGLENLYGIDIKQVSNLIICSETAA